MDMEAAVESFEYPGTLVKKVKLISREVTKKNEALASSQISFSKVKVTVEEANKSLNPSRKRIEE